MSTPHATADVTRSWPQMDLPFAVWMLLIALAIGFAGGVDAPSLMATFNDGWGRSIGYFALVLLPSFTLAAALSQHAPAGAASSAVGVSPVVGAGMVCPDTAYAALAPIAGRRRLMVGFGAYAGFKLLFPAGPLLVATGLGIADTTVYGYGLALFGPVWFAGLLWAWFCFRADSTISSEPPRSTTLASALAPFALLVVLVVAGAATDLQQWPVLDFLTRPPGALIAAAALALAGLAPKERRACLDTGVRRTGALLFLIGVASALGAVLVTVVPVDGLVAVTGGTAGLLSVVALAATFKLLQGSSMATFAAVTPLVAPFAAIGGLSPTATVLAVCVGSLVAVLPNDSFYWLVRQDALADHSERSALFVIASGSILQGVVGLIGLLLLHSSGVLG